MTSYSEPRVEGESAELLREAFAQMRPIKRTDGMVSWDGVIDAECGTAFLRALGHVDAELLVSDVRAGKGPMDGGRTDDQRRADAFIALVLRTAEALNGP